MSGTGIILKSLYMTDNCQIFIIEHKVNFKSGLRKRITLYRLQWFDMMAVRLLQLVLQSNSNIEVELYT